MTRPSGWPRSGASTAAAAARSAVRLGQQAQGAHDDGGLGPEARVELDRAVVGGNAHAVAVVPHPGHHLPQQVVRRQAARRHLRGQEGVGQAGGLGAGGPRGGRRIGTPSATTTRLATRTPEPTAQPPVLRPTPTGGPPPGEGCLYADDFSDPRSSWRQRDTDNHKWRYVDGQYEMTIGAGVRSEVHAPGVTLQEGSFEATVTLVAEPAARAGLLEPGAPGFLVRNGDTEPSVTRFDDVRVTCFLPDRPSPTPTATPPGDQPLFQDDFGNPRSGWPTVETENTAGRYVDGQFEIKVKTANITNFRRAPAPGCTACAIEVTTRFTTDLPTEAGIGVEWAAGDENKYLARITSDGWAAIDIDRVDDKVRTLVPPVWSGYIFAGRDKVNRLRLERRPGRLTLLVKQKTSVEAMTAAPWPVPRMSRKTPPEPARPSMTRVSGGAVTTRSTVGFTRRRWTMPSTSSATSGPKKAYSRLASTATRSRSRSVVSLEATRMPWIRGACPAGPLRCYECAR